MKNNMVEREARPQQDFLPRIGAGCLMVLGAFMLLGGIALLTDKDPGALGGFIFSLIASAALIAAGVFWYRYVRARDRQRIDLYEEKVLLGLAARRGGYLTLAVVALESACTAAEAEAAMARMVRQGFAQPEVMEDGTVRYRFGGLIAGSEE